MSRSPSLAPRAKTHVQPAVRQAAPNANRKVHFLLTDAYLVVANNGQPLTRMGLNALCRIGRSAKDAMRHSRLRAVDPPANMEQLEAIRERWLQVFEADPDRIAREASREAETCAKLADQLFYGMMQNANDASAATLPHGNSMLLGRSGRGFSAALSITDQPRIHSGDVSVTFDLRNAHKALKKRVGRKTPAEIPVVRLPFPCSTSDEPPEIRALIEAYDTVVVMPIRSLRACERCRAGWDSAVDDITLLKHLPAINVMIWERNDATAQYKRTIRDNVDRVVRSTDEGHKPGPVELIVRAPGSRRQPAAARAPGAITRSITRRPHAANPSAPREPRATLSAEVVPLVPGKQTPTGKKMNGAAAPTARVAQPAKARTAPNGKSASKSTSTAKKAATKARVSVSEKGTVKSTARKTAARKPASQKTAGTRAKKPAQKPAAKSTNTAKATPPSKPASKKPANAATKKPAQKSSAAAAKSKTRKGPAARKPAAKKPATRTKSPAKPKAAAGKKPATRKATAKPKAAAAKEPATRKSAAKSRGARTGATKKPSKSNASTKKS